MKRSLYLRPEYCSTDINMKYAMYDIRYITLGSDIDMKRSSYSRPDWYNSLSTV